MKELILIKHVTFTGFELGFNKWKQILMQHLHVDSCYLTSGLIRAGPSNCLCVDVVKILFYRNHHIKHKILAYFRAVSVLDNILALSPNLLHSEFEFRHGQRCLLSFQSRQNKVTFKYSG